MSYKPIDARRDEFRKYLERTGVLDMFTKVLSKLMSEDRPEDAIEFIRSNIGDSLNDKDTIASLNQKLEEANAVIAELRTKLRQYEPMEATDSDTISVADTVNTESTAELTTAAAPEPAKETAEPMQVDTTPKEAEPVAVTPAVATTEPAAPVPAAETPSATPAVAEPEKTDTPAEAEKTEGEKAAAEVEEKKTEPAPVTAPATEAAAEKQPEVAAAPAAEAPAAAPAEPTKPAEEKTAE